MIGAVLGSVLRACVVSVGLQCERARVYLCTSGARLKGAMGVTVIVLAAPSSAFLIPTAMSLVFQTATAGAV